MKALYLCWKLLNMLYQFLWGSVSLLSIFFNIFWFFCNLASAGIPWLTLILLIVCVASKFVSLRSPDEKRLLRLLGGKIPEDLTFWAIANRGAGYDAPENSKTALKMCSARGYHNVLLDAGLTLDREIVLINRAMLSHAGLANNIAHHTLDELQKINITKLHPMGSQFENECILTLTELSSHMENFSNLTIFLYISDNTALMVEKLKEFMKEKTPIMKRFIVVSRSPYAIYQLRKSNPELICGLYTEKSVSFAILTASTLITSIYGAIIRNIIAPVIGISVVFINKEEFNLHVAELWRNVGVRPIVYNVNSPNEKRYFQKTMKTQYLTDSLRSEPNMLTNA